MYPSSGCILTLSLLVGLPEFIPVVVGLGFDQCAQVPQPAGCPELARTLEAALALPTGRLDRATANRPASSGQGVVVHPLRVVGKVTLFATNDLPRRAAGR